MAIITSTGTVAQVEDDTAGTQAAYRNNEFAAIAHAVGNFGKIGNSLVAQLRMSMTPPVPSGAFITDARMEVVANTTQAGLFFCVFRTLIDDGIWNATHPFGPQHFRASRPLINIDFRLKVESTGAVPVFDDTLLFNGGGWEMRASTAGKFDRIGQGFTPDTTVNLGFITWKLSRNNNPAGNVFVELYSADVNGLADTLLATSNTIAATSPPTGVLGADRRFSFPVGQQPQIDAGTIYIAQLRGTYPVNGSAFVKAQFEGQTGGNVPGWPSFYGTTVGAFDDQAYPIDSDFQGIPVNAESVVVVIPAVVAGQTYDPTFNPGSGSLKAMMQAHVDRVAYTEGDPIGIRWEASTFLLDANDRRDFKSSPGNFAKLIIEWEDDPAIQELLKLQTAQGGSQVSQIKALGDPVSVSRSSGSPLSTFRSLGDPVSAIVAKGLTLAQLRSEAGPLPDVVLGTAEGGNAVTRIKALGHRLTAEHAEGSELSKLAAKADPLVVMRARADSVTVLRVIEDC